MMPNKSRLQEARDIELAAQMIIMGARTQVVAYEIPSISIDKAIALCKEITGDSPAKGALPFSTEWFLEFIPNIHSSLFLGIYQTYEKANSNLSRGELLIGSYKLYLEWTQSAETEPDLSFTRAWMLIRNVASGALKAKRCECCHGNFVVDGFHHGKLEHCDLCSVKKRSGPMAALSQKSKDGLFQEAWDS